MRGEAKTVQSDALWQAVLGEIELSVSHASFITWFKKTQILRHSDEEFVVGVPNIFCKQQLEAKFNNETLSPEKINELSAELQQIIETIEEKEFRWLELLEKLEN